jgi:cysteine-rich repeat protein
MKFIRLSLVVFGVSLLSGCGAERCDASFVNCLNEGERLEICAEGQFKLIEDCGGQGLVCDVVVQDCVSEDALCGNGVFNSVEECDDGKQCDNGDDCSLTGVCSDDSDCETRDGDGCDDECQIETGFSCIGEPSFCVNTCGDGIVQTEFGEECDDGGLCEDNLTPCQGSDDCVGIGGGFCIPRSGDSCGDDCRIECGDGIVEAGLGEECDDGGLCEDNLTPCQSNRDCDEDGEVLCTPRSGDGCNANCQSEVCGDSVVNNNGAEECDDGNPNIDDGCDPDCTTSKVLAVSAGGAHTCVLTASKRVRCWGNGTSGELGYGNTLSLGDDELPFVAGSVDLGGLAKQVSAGDVYTCAVLEDDTLRCWGFAGGGRLGYNNDNNIGDNETPASAGPVPVGIGVEQVAAGSSHTCARLIDGNIRCWGNNNQGLLGYGNLNNVGGSVGVPITTAGNVDVGAATTLLSLGATLTCVTTSTDVRCWGNSGSLGYGNTDSIGDDETPSSRGGISMGSVTSLDSGAAHSCVIVGGNISCWGDNNAGQLGRGNTQIIGDNETAVFQALSLGGSAAQVSAGVSHTCAVLTTGAVRCWGRGLNGVLGNLSAETIGDNGGEMPPADVALGVGAVQVSAGTVHTCIVSAVGAVRCWGVGTNGRLGYGSQSSIGDDETPASAGDVKVF